MARTNSHHPSTTPARERAPAAFLATNTPHASQQSSYLAPQASPSAASDKENNPTSATAPGNKGKGRMAAPAKRPTSASNAAHEAHSAKRRRVEISQNAHQFSNHIDREEDLDERKYYNPDQDPEERQDLKRRTRALERKFADNRDEYLRANHDGIEQTITEANLIFGEVKQTSDATVDSRLMVNVADTLSKKTAHMAVGSTSTGLDVDEFVSKCVAFMRKEPADAEGSATQRRRRRQSRQDNDEDEDETAILDWASLGCAACFPSNLRPPVPGFLLGPLSLQKKARTQTQRRARQARDTAVQEVRPQALTQDELGQAENDTLTVICSKIRSTLQRHCDRAQAAAEENGDIDDELMTKYRVSEMGGPHLFDFVVNPRSFGQTVENMFYVSFLLKEGHVGIEMNDEGLPILMPADPGPPKERHGKGSKRHHSVWALDKPTWRDAIRAFDIREPLIEHRREESTSDSTSWHE